MSLNIDVGKFATMENVESAESYFVKQNLLKSAIKFQHI